MASKSKHPYNQLVNASPLMDCLINKINYIDVNKKTYYMFTRKTYEWLLLISISIENAEAITTACC